MVVIRKPCAIICDIEEVTVSGRFFPDKMKPYIVRNFRKFLQNKWGDPTVMELITRLRNEYDPRDPIEAIPELTDRNDAQVFRAVVTAIAFYLNEKRKTATLIGMDILIWIEAFKSDQLKTQVFEDVPDLFHIWRKHEKIPIYIFSSASKELQQLLFSSTEHGNLLPLIKDFFSASNIGLKTDRKSWDKISMKIGIPPREIIFISKNPLEARAAAAVGIKPLLALRPGNKINISSDEVEFKTIKTFYDIQLK